MAAAVAATPPLAERLVAAQDEGLDANLRRFLRFRGAGARGAYPLELQALGIPSGRFEESRFAHARTEDEAAKLTAASERFGGFGVFAIANAINPAVATREAAGAWHAAKKGGSTTDADVTGRLLLFVDIDAKRPRGTSSSAEELALTFPVAELVAAHFPPDSIGYGHSGNGASVFVALDTLAETSILSDLVRGILGKLGRLYSRPGVEIDGSVCDAKRLCPAFGTTKRKGAHGVAERPHRRTAFVGPSDPRRLTLADLEIVDAGLTELCPDAVRRAREPQKFGAKLANQGGDYDRANRVDVRLVLGWLGLLDGDQPTCPGCRESDGSSVAIVGNAIKCLHSRCRDRGHPRHPGFRTPVDIVCEANGVEPHEAVREICEHFLFDAPRPQVTERRAAAPTRPVERPADVADCYDPGDVGDAPTAAVEAVADPADVEREAIQAEKADSKMALLERLLAGATAKRDWTAAAKHAAALSAHRSGKPIEWPRITCPELLQPLPPVPWLCEGIDLAPGPCTMLAGYGYSGKTAATQALALAVATGTRAWGRYDVRQGKVLHIDYEQGRRLTVERYQRLAKALAATNGCTKEQIQLIATSLSVAIMPPDVLDGPHSEVAFMRELEGHALAVIDSYRAACPHTEENDSSSRVPLDMLARVSEATGCTIVVIHHGRKDPPGGGGSGKQSMRGSSALFDAPQLVLQLTSDGAPAGRPGTNYAMCSSTKARITGRAIAPFRLRYDDIDEYGCVNPESRFGLSVTAEEAGGAEDAAIDAAADRVLAFVRANGGCTTAEIKAGVRGEAGIKVAAMDRLKRAGALVNRGGSGGAGRAAAWFAPRSGES